MQHRPGAVGRLSARALGLSAFVALYEITGQPRWNRYIVYYATRNEEGGHLYKLVLEPAPPPVAPVPLPLTELQDNSKDDPSLNIFQGGNPAFVQLARNVQEFSFENKSGTIVVHLTLRERRGARPNSASGSGVEVFELVTAVRPEYTSCWDKCSRGV